MLSWELFSLGWEDAKRDNDNSSLNVPMEHYREEWSYQEKTWYDYGYFTYRNNPIDPRLMGK